MSKIPVTYVFFRIRSFDREIVYVSSEITKVKHEISAYKYRSKNIRRVYQRTVVHVQCSIVIIRAVLVCMHRYLAPKARYVRSNRFLVEILRQGWRKPFRSNLKIIFDRTFLRLWRHHETIAFPGLIRNPGMCAIIVETV